MNFLLPGDSSECYNDLDVFHHLIANTKRIVNTHKRLAYIYDWKMLSLAQVWRVLKHTDRHRPQLRTGLPLNLLVCSCLSSGTHHPRIWQLSRTDVISDWSCCVRRCCSHFMIGFRALSGPIRTGSTTSSNACQTSGEQRFITMSHDGQFQRGNIGNFTIRQRPSKL